MIDSNKLELELNRGISFQKKGENLKAKNIYLEILHKNPHHPDALNLLGTIFQESADHQKAISFIENAIRSAPDIADYYSNLAVSQLAIGKIESAYLSCSKAVEIDQTFPIANYNLGNSLFAMGRADEAIKFFKVAIDLEPSNDKFWSNYLFALNFRSNLDNQEVCDENCRWGNIKRNKNAETTRFVNSKETNRPLRIAYFLPELDQHVTPRFLKPILSNHNKAKFVVYIYGYTNKGKPQQFLTKGPHIWVDIKNMRERDIAQKIRSDRIDIFIHPCTFKTRYRNILRYKPAPIQIAGINLVSTTGLEETSYLLSDEITTPYGSSDKFFTEKLVRLSQFNVFGPSGNLPKIILSPVFKNRFITFGCFNNPTKYGKQCISLWSKILLKSPKNKLLLKHRAFENTEVRNFFTKQFVHNGVNETQLLYSGYTQKTAKYLEHYNLVDICLDPIPFGGGTTSYEAVIMGVPIITLLGNSIMGRLTASIMKKIGYHDFVTDSAADYVNIADKLYDRLTLSEELKINLRKEAKNRLFDAKSYTEELEQNYQRIWSDYCKTR